LIPPKSSKYLFLFAPFMGVAVLEFGAQTLSGFGIACRGALIPTGAAIFFLTAAGLAVWRKNGLGFFPWAWSARAAPLGFGFAGALILTAPLIARNALTWFGGGTDATGYIRYAYY